MKNFAFPPLVAALFWLIISPLAIGAGVDPDRQITGSQLLDLVEDKTWYGWSIDGEYAWIEYYGPNGDAFYLDDQGFLPGTWWLRGEQEICFDYPSLGTFCFTALETPAGQVAIYDLKDHRLIHVTTRIAEGDAASLRLNARAAAEDEVGQD